MKPTVDSNPSEIRILTKASHPHLPVWGAPRAPKVIYGQGSERAFQSLERCPTLTLAVVGTREPYSTVARFLSREIQKLRDTQMIIVSGFARGIDRIAHEAAIAAGLPTIAVFGSGIHRTYPREHFHLRETILKNDGLLLSEFEPDDPPRGHHFVLRNRLIAALSHSLLVAQAPEKSGALITAAYALELDRVRYAIPSLPTDPGSLGSNRLLELNEALPFWSADSLRFSFSLPISREKQQSFEFTDGDDESILETIERRCHEFGSISRYEVLDIALSSGLTREETFAAIDRLIDRQRVVEQAGVLIVNESC